VGGFSFMGGGFRSDRFCKGVRWVHWVVFWGLGWGYRVGFDS